MNLNGMDFVNYIVSLNKEEKQKILNSNEIRIRLFNANSHYEFVWLVQSLKDEEILYLLDDNIIDLVLNDSRSLDKMNAILTCGNPYMNEFIKNNKIIDFIIFNFDSLSYYLKGLNTSLADCIYNKLLDEKKYNYLKYISSFNPNVQIELFNLDNIIKLFKIKDLNYNFIIDLDSNLINKFFRYEKFKMIFLESNIGFINKLLSKNNIILPIELVNNQILITKYSTIENPIKYLNSINIIEKNNINLAENIKKERKRFLDSKINNIEDFNFTKYRSEQNFMYLYEKENNQEEFMINFNKKVMFEILITHYFKEIPGNLLINLRTILEYNSKLENSLIPSSRLKIYNTINNVANLDIYDLKKLYYELDNDVDYSKIFYEDFKKSINHSINSYNNEFLKLNKENNLYNKELSNQYGVDIYKLDGEPFLACCHTTSLSDDNQIIWKNNQETISLSIIGNKNITSYNMGFGYLTVGFNNLNADKIMHISNVDSYTSKQYSTNKIQRIYNSNDLQKETVGYNEILYSEKSETLKPDFIIAYDTIKPIDIRASKEFNIPIVIINSKKYIQKNGLESITDNSYLDYEEAKRVFY